MPTTFFAKNQLPIHTPKILLCDPTFSAHSQNILVPCTLHSKAQSNHKLEQHEFGHHFFSNSDDNDNDNDKVRDYDSDDGPSFPSFCSSSQPNDMDEGLDWNCPY